MRPLRLLLTSLCLVLGTTFLLYIRLSSAAETNSDSGQHARVGRGFDNYFAFPRASSFFTPSATISLTDDNSTYFAARPAAFGPLLPRFGLSGQIWVGKGFGNDYLKKSGMIQDFEGELGCSDIPGWIERGGVWKSTLKFEIGADTEGSGETGQRSERIGYTSGEELEAEDLPAKDGSDDDLHYPLQSTSVPRRYTGSPAQSKESRTQLSDIQSIQESAEISGKIVLLSRGGCGFSEKVKWAQRRGATAVIVGDNQLGGPLVRMYARGDTSNITVPSIFTSHTTAHLLSSLVPHGSSLEASQSGFLGPTGEGDKAPLDGKPDAAPQDRVPDIAGTNPPSTATSRGVVNPTMYPFNYEVDGKHDDSSESESQKGWLRSSLHALGIRDSDEKNEAGTDESHRPPGSGNLMWLRVEEFEEDEAWQATRRSTVKHHSAKDDFVIGVHDWRDPDVANKPPSSDRLSKTLKSSASVASSTASIVQTPANGGFITPGSGEYGIQVEGPGEHREKYTGNAQGDSNGKSHHKAGWRKHLPWGREMETTSSERLDGSVNDHSSSHHTTSYTDNGKSFDEDNNGKEKNRAHHDGLWVTLTPSDMNTSPFLNTLFILVVSPLITLAIVYSMLLLRSRIRRRRWRAPKSLVERLPVRVYHTFSQTNTPPPESSQSSAAENAATPLLSRNRAPDIRPRPRSNTIGVASSTSASPHYGTLEAPSSSHEKPDSALGEWRRKYEGKQMECVVCLEEYIDGVSRVMSLPCGHEFHVDCITPWLTTRRRTCPICKGDVVRSMNQSSAFAASAPDADMAEDDVQAQAAETVNNSPAAAMPIPSSDSATADVERGDAALNTPSEQTYLSTSWIGSVGRRLNIISGRSSSISRTPRETPPDRNR